MASEYLIKPATEAIKIAFVLLNFQIKLNNYSFRQRALDKTNITNYRPVSVFNVFSKFYEKVIKGQLTEFFDRHLSIFVSTYF